MNRHKSHLILFLSLVLLLTLSSCGGQETPNPEPVVTIGLDHVVAEGRILPAFDSWLNFSAQGKVAEILVKEGEKVSQGQILIRLADSEEAVAGLLAAELESIVANQNYDDFLRTSDLSSAQAWQAYLVAQELRAEAEREWEDLDLDYLEDRIDDARVKVRDLETDLSDDQEEVDKYQDVDENNYARQTAQDNLEDTQDDYNEALRDLEEAIRKIDGPRAELDSALAVEIEARREFEMWAQEGFNLDQLTLLESRVSATDAGRVAAQSRLDNYALTAPFDGTVTDIYLDLGQFVGPETRAAQLADLSDFIIKTSDLTELEVVKISEGQAVEIIPDALPNLVLTGIVERISQSFTTQAGDIIYTVTIRLDKTDPALRWGMTVELTFLPE